jgi:hypothetical protein
MKNTDVLKAFSFGPDTKDLRKNRLPRMRVRCSKLQKHSEYIQKLRTERKSFQFIVDCLKKLEVVCDRSTVLRFCKNKIAL